jgi:uncharacterized lipoprotein YmbA
MQTKPLLEVNAGSGAERDATVEARRGHGTRLQGWNLRSTIGLALALGAALVASCSLPMPQAQNDPTRMYVLSVPPAAPATGDSVTAPVVRLRPVEVASYLRTREMVVRRGENEIDFREFARWGEPLEQGITRVLREELLEKHAASSVDTSGLRSAEAGDAKYEILVRVLACEGLADGGVDFRAVWEISSTTANAGAPVRGEYRATNLKWTPRHEATLAAALSQAVAGLANDIAGGLKR